MITFTTKKSLLEKFFLAVLKFLRPRLNREIKSTQNFIHVRKVLYFFSKCFFFIFIWLQPQAVLNRITTYLKNSLYIVSQLVRLENKQSLLRDWKITQKHKKNKLLCTIVFITQKTFVVIVFLERTCKVLKEKKKKDLNFFTLLYYCFYFIFNSHSEHWQHSLKMLDNWILFFHRRKIFCIID